MFETSKIKRTLKSIIPSVILLMNFSVVNAQEISDINYSSDYAIESIQNLSKLGIVSGDEKGNFNPKKAVTRSEMIKMVVKALNIDTTNVESNAVFKDVPKENWAFEYVQAAYEEGIVKGISEEEFGKDQKCTREQMAVMFVRALSMNKGNDILNNINGIYDKNNISDWAKKEVDLAIESGLMNGVDNNTFDPKGDAKREQVAVVIDRFIKNKEELNQKYVNSYKYSQFYDVVEKAASTQYKGEIHSTVASRSKFKPIYGGEYFMNSNVIVEQFVNNDDYKMTFTVSNNTNLPINDEELQNGEYEIIKIDNKLYVKEYDVWEEYEIEDDIDNEIKIIDNSFYYNFNKYNIKREEDVYVDGINTTKYVVELKSEDILDILSDDKYAMLAGTLEGLDYGLNYNEIEFDYEYYINDENEIIEIKIELNPITINNEDGIIEINFNSTSNFKNVGKEIEIKLPTELR